MLRADEDASYRSFDCQSGQAESMREESSPRQIAGTWGSDLGRRPPGLPFAYMMSLFSSVAPYMPYVGSK